MSAGITVLVINNRGQALAHRSGEVLSVDVESGRYEQQLTAAIKDRWGLDTFMLTNREAVSIPVLRLQDRDADIWHEGLEWQRVDRALDSVPADNQMSLRRICVGQMIDSRFGSYRWFDVSMALVKQRLQELGYRVIGIQQRRGDQESVVLRFDTNRGTVWFKAVAGPSQQECHISSLLATRYPGLFPRVLAHWPDHRMMLVEHLEGRELADSEDIADWIAVAKLLAESQVSSVGKAASLIEAGAPDVSPERLRQIARPFCLLMEEIMANQPDIPPARLGKKELRRLCNGLEDACAEASTLPFASALTNADFSPHNVILTDRGPRFFDWAETIAGFPLVTGEYLWNRMATETPSRGPWRPMIEDAYRAVWDEAFGPRIVKVGFTLVPFIAPFTVAVYLGGWRFQGKPATDEPYLRTLTRHMFRHLAEKANTELRVHDATTGEARVANGDDIDVIRTI